MNEPKICIVGAGRLSTKRIYPNIGAAGAILVGACDRELAKAQSNARRWGGRAYADMDAMLDAERPDGVIICINPQMHATLAPRVMERGIPVYTEKPPAPTAAAALGVARVSAQTGVLCMTAFKKRYNLAYSRAQKWLAQFAPDDFYSLSIDYASAQYSNQGDDQFLFDFAIHAIDLAPFLFGDVAEVFAFAKGGDAYAVSLKFCNGAVGSLNLNDGRSFTVPTEEVEISLRGGHWMTIHNSSQWKIADNGQPTEWREPPTFTSGGDSGNETGHLAELVAFVKALGGAETVRSAIYEGYKSLVLHEAILQSAHSGAVVKPKYEAL